MELEDNHSRQTSRKESWFNRSQLSKKPLSGETSGLSGIKGKFGSAGYWDKLEEMKVAKLHNYAFMPQCGQFGGSETKEL